MGDIVKILLMLLLTSCVVERKLPDDKYFLYFSRDGEVNYALDGDFVVPYTFKTRKQMDTLHYVGIGTPYEAKNIRLRK